MRRREFLRGVAALGTVPLAAGLAPAFAHPIPVSSGFVLTDRRFPQSRAFGRQGVALGLTRLETEGDLGGLWVQGLSREIAANPASIQGLVRPSSLLCLETLAREQWMHVAFRAVHLPNNLAAAVCAEGAMASASEIEALFSSHPDWRDPEWGAGMARIACARTALSHPVMPATTREIAAGDDALITFVLVPRRAERKLGVRS